MSYNRYGGNNPYGAPPGYGGYGAPAAGGAPGLGPPPGMGAPGMSAAPGMMPPGMAPPGMAPPGMQQANLPQSGRPGGLPPNFQPPANLPNINFNAPVIRMGTSTPTSGGRYDNAPTSGGGRAGLGMDRGSEQNRGSGRDTVQTLMPPTNEEKLHTLFFQHIPDGVGGDEGMHRLLDAVGGLRRWDSWTSVMDGRKNSKFGFALFDGPESLNVAVKVLHDEGIEVPVKRQPGTSEPPEDDAYDGIEKSKLEVFVDPNSLNYLESVEESRGDDGSNAQRLSMARAMVKRALRELFYPPSGAGLETDADRDVKMSDEDGAEIVEVVNIPLAQDDELADIPAEMRAVVAGEIASFRERSNQRDMERLRKEEEMEEIERRRNGAHRPSRLDSPPPGANNVPLGPRSAMPNAPSGPKGQNGSRGPAFVNGGISNAEHSMYRDDDETDASDEELNRRQKAKQQADDDRLYMEAERKWINRERSRQAALEREQGRERQDAESIERRAEEQLDKERTWDDEREASRRTHPYYRDHAGWVRKRTSDREEEEARDAADRRGEQDEQRREQAQAERARGMADSFLDEQAEEMSHRDAAPSAPQPFKLSLGAAAQKAQASRSGPQRRTIADVEGLLDDEEAEPSTKRQLIPIQFDPSAAAAGMTEEEISQAVRALAQEIPSDKEGLWKWQVKWDFMDDSVVRDKLRPFVEKKIVEYLGVQEEMLVGTVEEHLRSHGTAGALAEELEGALDDEAEDLVKKLWRMVIFFTECEKRGLPA